MIRHESPRPVSTYPGFTLGPSRNDSAFLAVGRISNPSAVVRELTDWKSVLRSCFLAAPLRLAVVLFIAVLTCTASVTGADADVAREDAAKARFAELVSWLPKDLPTIDEVVAFEEHAHFAYIAGRLSPPKETVAGDENPAYVRYLLLRPITLVVEIWPFRPKQHALSPPAHIILKHPPSGKRSRHALSEKPPGGKRSQRAIYLYHPPAEQRDVKFGTLAAGRGPCKITIQTIHAGGNRFDLELPLGLEQTARIAVEAADGKALLAKRRLPAGVMPVGAKGMRQVEVWDARYRADSRPPWDKGFPARHLKAAVEDGTVKPGRALVLGCGTGTNAVYLAKKGFDVTAVDIAPTALNLAEEKASKAKVTVRWVLADVLATPSNLKPFDFIFDRGCYHGVRRGNAQGYVETLEQLSRPGTQVMILAGNANEARHYGPPRVKEEELRGDFSAAFEFVKLDTINFDSGDPQKKGALGWLVLLCRKADDGGHSRGE